ncbi:uncharacterized protein LOC122851936 [Aphidius gifuensis]|nr:uncharacterized protein LOC122851936 [Aphidius gifuensis]XP_044007407.1 uncharacterized protein LOC122851936 [Aphidius gifuensis]
MFFPDMFGPSTLSSIPSTSSSALSTQKTQTQAQKGKRKNWTDAQVRFLIELWTKYRPNFESTAMSTAQVWKLVANEEGYHTPVQLSDKWKALKKVFASEMEKVGDKNTGGKADDKWKFFDEFYELFKDDPKYTPVCIASSRKGSANLHTYKKVEDENKNRENCFDNSSSDYENYEYLDNTTSDNESTSEISTPLSTSTSSAEKKKNNSTELPTQLSTSTPVSAILLSRKRNNKSTGEVDQLPPSKKTKADLFIEKLEKSDIEREKRMVACHQERMEMTGMAVKYLVDISNTMKKLVGEKVEKT